MPPLNKPYPGQKPQMQPVKKKSHSSAIALLVSALILVAVGYFIVYPFLSKYLKTPHSLTFVVADTPVRTTSRITAHAEEPEIAVVQETPPATVVNEPNIAVVRNRQPASAKGFYVIVGSFPTKASADNFVKTKGNAINLEVLSFEELGLYRISAGYFDNIRSAYNAIPRVKDTGGFANAWVLENR